MPLPSTVASVLPCCPQPAQTVPQPVPLDDAECEIEHRGQPEHMWVPQQQQRDQPTDYVAKVLHIEKVIGVVSGTSVYERSFSASTYSLRNYATLYQDEEEVAFHAWLVCAARRRTSH